MFNKLVFCLQDINTVYHVGIFRLGAAHVFGGVASLILGIVLTSLCLGDVWAGVGIWTGLPFLICGLFCILKKKRRPLTKVSAPAGWSLIALLFSVFLVVTCGVGLAFTVANKLDLFYPNYRFKNNHIPLYAVNISLLLVAVFELSVSLWSLVVSLGLQCPCCKRGRDNVYTIPYEEMKDTAGDPVEAPSLRLEINFDDEDFRESPRLANHLQGGLLAR